MTDTFWKGIAILALLASLVAIFFAFKGTSPNYGSIGLKYAEQYDPYIKYNGGYNSALPIQTSSTFSAATTTLSQQVNLTNPTLCFNYFATSTATSWKLVASSTALVNGSEVVLAAYGSCAN